MTELTSTIIDAVGGDPTARAALAALNPETLAVIEAAPAAADRAEAAAAEAAASAEDAAEAIALRFVDVDDSTYIGYLVDSSAEQNILARFRRDTGAMEYIKSLEDVAIAVAAREGQNALRPTGARLRNSYRRWGKAGGVTVTTATTNDTALTVRYSADASNPAPFTFYGGTPVQTGGGLRVHIANYTAITQFTGRMAFITDAPVVQIAIGPGSRRKFRIYVDGALASDEAHEFPGTTGGIWTVRLTFPTALPRGRRIDVEIGYDTTFNVSTFGWNTVALPNGHTAWPVDTSTRVKIAVLGDSYTDGSGSSFPAFGWAYELGRQLGGVDVDVLAEGRGGTGYISAGSGRTANSAANGYNNPYTAGDPLRLDNIAAFAPDLLIYALGTNDDGLSNAAADLQPAALYAYQQARTRMPNVPIIVIGPWPAGSGPSANKIAAENYIRAAVDLFGDPHCLFVPVCTASPKPWWYGTGRSGAKNGTGPSDWIIGGESGSDATHPTDNGHRFIAARATAEVLSIVRNFTRY